MGWNCGLVGLPNAGKSTLFKALTKQNVSIDSYPFSTVDPNRARVPISDPRLDELATMCNSTKKTPATIEVIDVAGLVKGASRGEGLGNQFLGHLRNVDLLIHVVSAFDVNPTDEWCKVEERINTINIELCLADLETVLRRIEKNKVKGKSGDKATLQEMSILEYTGNCLNQGCGIISCQIEPGDKKCLEPLNLLTAKKMLFVLNTSEQLDAVHFGDGFSQNSFVVPVCAKLEAELSDLGEDDLKEFLQEYGLNELQSKKLLTSCYQYLELISFYTVKGTEAKSWVVPCGTNALDASAKIHSDIKQGFINVEVVDSSVLVSAGSLSSVREKGMSRIEGKEYIVQDGDVLFFRFR